MSKNEPIKTKCVSWDVYKLITSICARNSITCITECTYNVISSPWYLHGIEIIKTYKYFDEKTQILHGNVLLNSYI